MPQKPDIDILEEMREQVRLGGGKSRIERQHKKGKRTARERIEYLVDPGSFIELGVFATSNGFHPQNDRKKNVGDGVITGRAEINDQAVYLFAQDFTVMGGSVGRTHGKKIAHIMDLAYQNGAPLIGLNDSGGARIQEGVNALAAYGDIFYRNARSSGIIPQISVILGPCAGGAVYSPAMMDFVFMVEKTSQMFITGPDVIKEVTHEEIDLESLGSAHVHNEQSGVAHFSTPDEKTALSKLRWLLSFLPPNNLTPPPSVEPEDKPERMTPELSEIVPLTPKEPYDVRRVIRTLVDDGEILEVHEKYAKNIVVCFAHLDGHPVGMVANQPDHFAGVLDINASDKGARFIRFCDSFHIPLITLVDTPGFLPGIEQEHEGIIRHGAKMIYAYAEATVPKISLILRKAYGGAYIVMSSKHLHGDVNLAWPQAEIAVMGPRGAVKIIHREELRKASDSQQMREKYTQEYREKYASPFIAAGQGYLDDIIKPRESRMRLIKSLEMLLDKRETTPNRKHGNIPL
ncbi:MAG: acyl-CoA carboxylase subunit beta [Anaerolineales bacterium]